MKEMYFKLEDASSWSCELKSYYGKNNVSANFNIRFSPKPKTTTTEITVISENMTLIEDDQSMISENMTLGDEEDQSNKNITEDLQEIANLLKYLKIALVAWF